MKSDDKINDKEPVLSIRNLSISFGENKVLVDFNLDLFKNQNIVGAINFYRPSDVQMDTSFTFHTDSILTQNIITQNLKKGILKRNLHNV